MNYRNARYIDDKRIDCEIEHPHLGWVPYTLDPDDKDMTVDNGALLSLMLESKSIAAYTPPTQEERDAQNAALMRTERDRILAAEVDQIAGNALRWASLSDAQRQAWANYRQALLDVPQQDGFPYGIHWPTKPE